MRGMKRIRKRMNLKVAMRVMMLELSDLRERQKKMRETPCKPSLIKQ